MILPGPALRRLFVLRTLGAMRKQFRRARTAKGALFALLGLAALVLWAVGFYFTQRGHPRRKMDSEALRFAVQLGGAAFAFVSALGALSHRGLYLPRDEIERLLSAPLKRSDLVRYRALAGLLRALPGSIIVSVFLARRAQHALIAGLGVLLCMLFLPLLTQGVSLLAGNAENRLVARLTRMPLRALNIVVALLVGAFMLGLIWGFEHLGVWARSSALGEIWPAAQAIAQRATLPLLPFARMVSAESWREFLTFAVPIAGAWCLLFEGIARLKVDFRELSLDTSASVARSLRRYRAVGGMGTAQVAQGSGGWRIPWLFGRGPMGAVAWRKTCAIVRKARGTLSVATLLLLVLVGVSRVVVRDYGENQALLGGLLVVGLGALYLCLGLRFDFREDLDRMDQVKSWPLAPTALFAATILPEAVLVSVLVALAACLRCVWLSQYDVRLLGVLLAVPIWVIAWAAIDNALLLFAPVRPTPGQEGALHYTGRALVLLLLRVVVATLVAALLAGVYWGATALGWALDWSLPSVRILQAVASLAVLALVVLGLLRAGGAMLRRFDVSSDRPA